MLPYKLHDKLYKTARAMCLLKAKNYLKIQKKTN